MPRLGTRISNAALLTGGTLLTLAGMLWLSRAGVESAYLASVALPMMLVGAGQGLAFAPLTNAGIAGVASGLVYTAHQLGMALELGILVTISTHAGTSLAGPAAVAEHVRVALTGASILLGGALLVFEAQRDAMVAGDAEALGELLTELTGPRGEGLPTHDRGVRGGQGWHSRRGRQRRGTPSWVPTASSSPEANSFGPAAEAGRSQPSAGCLSLDPQVGWPGRAECG